MDALDARIARLSDLVTMLMATLNGLEDARDGEPENGRYVGLSAGHQAMYRMAYAEGERLKGQPA